MAFADASGVPIHFELAGSGPPLVLLHGFVGDSTTWRHAGYVDTLASRFTVILAADPAAVAASYAAMADWRGVMDELAGVQMPTLVLAGDRDPSFADMRATAESIPGARLAPLPGCGHLDTFTRSDLALPLALSFLTETLTEPLPPSS